MSIGTFYGWLPFIILMSLFFIFVFIYKIQIKIDERKKEETIKEVLKK